MVPPYLVMVRQTLQGIRVCINYIIQMVGQSHGKTKGLLTTLCFRTELYHVYAHLS